MRKTFLFLVIWCVSWAFAGAFAWAQEVAVTEAEYAAWETTASRAESAIDTGRASNEAFEVLRAEVAGWRDRFLAAQDLNAARIATLRSQIEALGAPPAEGEVERPELAERRSALASQLADARAPVLVAEEAFNRADGLVKELAAIIRERQAQALFRLGPSPLLPGNWLIALAEINRAISFIEGETSLNLSSDIRVQALQNAMPVIVFLTALALILMIGGRRIVEQIRLAIWPYLPRRARRLTSILSSIFEIGLPLLGLVCLVAAIQRTGLLGLRSTALVSVIPQFGAYLFGAYWLGTRLFVSQYFFKVEEKKARQLRRAGTTLGLLYGLTTVLDAVTRFDSLSDATLAVIFFPCAVLAGLSLLQMGFLLIRAAQPNPDNDTPVFGLRWLRLAGRLTIAAAVIGVTLQAIGYLEAGLSLLLPTIGSLALIGLLFIVTATVRQIYSLIVDEGDEDTSSDALIPTVLSLLVVLVSLPFFALIWGASRSDLFELWARFRGGFTLGDARISPEVFLTFVFVFVALYVATRIVQGALRSNVLPKTRVSKGGQTAIVSGVGYIGIMLAALISISVAGIDLSSIALVAGALSVGIGFGLQNIVQNFVSGIILLIERPVAEGDWVEVGGVTGIVKKISVRSTLIETFDKVDVIVPNGDFIASAVKNWTRANNIGRIIVTVGVAYGTDPRRVHDILAEIAREHPLVTVDPEPGIDFLGFGADSLDFRIRAVLSDVNFSLAVKNEMHYRIAERFAEEGIEIPFAQRDVWLRNPETLRPTSPQAPQVRTAATEGASHQPVDRVEELTPRQMGDEDAASDLIDQT